MQILYSCREMLWCVISHDNTPSLWKGEHHYFVNLPLSRTTVIPNSRIVGVVLSFFQLDLVLLDASWCWKQSCVGDISSNCAWSVMYAFPVFILVLSVCDLMLIYFVDTSCSWARLQLALGKCHWQGNCRWSKFCHSLWIFVCYG